MVKITNIIIDYSIVIIEIIACINYVFQLEYIFIIDRSNTLREAAMRRFWGELWRAIQVVGLCLVLLPALGAEPIEAAKPATPGLWIAADRIVGFVPFTVYVYGKVVGDGAGHLELCRSNAAWIAESANARRVEGASPRPAAPIAPSAPPGPQCAAGHLNPTPDGFDYSHDLRFDSPGTYQLRLVMVGRDGGRMVSNSVRVRAF